jgi:hypothetical protein
VTRRPERQPAQAAPRSPAWYYSWPAAAARTAAQRRAGPHVGASSTRVRVRVRNALRRWAAAQADPRLSWVDRLAPAGNFAMVAWALSRLRACRARPASRSS